MLHKLGFALSSVMLIVVLQSCSSGGDTIYTTEGDTTKHNAGYFSNMTTSISWAPGSPMVIQLTIDSAVHPLSVQPGDTVWYVSYDHNDGVKRYDTLWRDALHPIVVVIAHI